MPIELKNLTREFKRSGSAFRAVDGVNLHIEPGDFVSVIGRSGSGKSTLLNLLALLLYPTSGTIEVDGQDVSLWKDKEASVYRNSKIGYIPQGQSMLSGLSVLDNVRAPYHFFNKNGDSTELAQSLLRQVGISHLAEAYPKQLSGGEKKRVAIARALINHPAYVIADEPTGDLDAQTTIEIMGLFKEIAGKGTAVLMVTHELDTLDYGSRTFVMDSGVLTERLADDI